MVTLSTVERARLNKLGKYAINSSEKQNAILSILKGGPGEPPMPECLYLPVVTVSSQKLLVLGVILGNHDEQNLTAAGEKMLSEHFNFKNDQEERFKATVMKVADYWVQLQEMGQASFDVYYKTNTSKQAPAREAAYKKMDPLLVQLMRGFEEWVKEELLQVSVSAGETSKPEKACAFCGTKSDKVLVALLTCGRCMGVLYCDKECQKMHWKKEHKAICKVKTSEVKAKDDGTV